MQPVELALVSYLWNNLEKNGWILPAIESAKLSEEARAYVEPLFDT